ncbi:MCE family protein [Polaribacter sp. ALD11]|uniref:MlaD family protein n=1 Tax=Polaribacter sp. ALD11 TaxID=2058137 RepID=UPI000C3138C1|nr:MlaD family protein [Polaribacter sp. ALD11]AUC84622.1 MCE family protein [Polaribacter sp. ALD11]
MQKSNLHKTRVGLFVVLGTGILLAALYFIGSKQHLFSKNMQLYAVFQNVNGLQLGNNVRYSGINVGTVSGIKMINNTEIVVEMMIEDKTGAFIKKDAIASIGSDGLVGSMVINIIPGKENLQTVISTDTIASHRNIGTEDLLSTLSITNKNAALLTADLLKITNKILKGEGALGALITDSLLTKDIRATLVNLKQTTNGANRLIGSLNYKFSKIDVEDSAVGVLLTDTVAGNQAKNVFLQLETSSIKISEATKMLSDMIVEISTAESTFNYLTKDKSLPKTIDSTMVQIKEASQKLNENMEALQHNFFFRGYFRKQERKAKRKAKSKKE